MGGVKDSLSNWKLAIAGPICDSSYILKASRHFMSSIGSSILVRKP